MRLDRDGSEPDEGTARKTRRRWAVEEKRRIVEETLQPGASVAEVALAHSVNANQLHSWRRQYEQGFFSSTTSTAALVPVRLVEGHESIPGSLVKGRHQVSDPPTATRRLRSTGIIQVELERGRLRVEGSSDPVALRVVLECLLR